MSRRPTVEQSKTCVSCRETKPVTEYRRGRSRKDGYEPYCKACCRAMYQGLNPRKPDPNRPVAGPGEKVCAKCVSVKPVTEFGAHRKFSDGLFPYCRECKRASDRASHAKHKPARNAAMREDYRRNADAYKARARKAYLADPERWNQGARAWALANPERRREIANASSRRRWAADPEKFREAFRRRHAAIKRGCAVYQFTTDQLAAKVAYWDAKCWICSGPWDSIDHVKPLNKGGPHMLANLRPVCTPCNTRKLDRWPYVPAA